MIFFGCLYAKDNEIMPIPSTPFIEMLKAVESSDIEKFKTSYSKRIRDDESQNNWEQNIAEAKINIKKLFGDIRYEDFTFKFDDEKSKLGIIHKGKFILWVGVIKEDGLWKLDER